MLLDERNDVIHLLLRRLEAALSVLRDDELVATNTTSDEIRGLQSGQVQQYAYVFLCGALALILLLIL